VCLGVVCVARLLLGCLLGPASALGVDLARELGDVGEDDHRVVAHVHEAAVHGRHLLGPVGPLDARRVDRERPEERRVARQEGDLAVAHSATDDHVGLAAEEDAFGRDELDLHGHDGSA